MKIEILREPDRINSVLKFVSTVSDCNCGKLKDEIITALRHKDDFVLLTVDGDIRGVFVFCVEREDRYIEMLYAISADKSSYDEAFLYLAKNYKDFQLDAVIRSGNLLLEQKLKAINAEFYPPQTKMVLDKFVEYKNGLNIVPFNERHRNEYLSIHSADTYWTGDKVLNNLNIFKIFLALEQDKVIGYIDVTYNFEEVEPYDLFVKKEYCGKGYEKALLSSAIKNISPKKMMVLLEAEDACAIRMYGDVGFICTNEQIQTATVKL